MLTSVVSVPFLQAARTCEGLRAFAWLQDPLRDDVAG